MEFYFSWIEQQRFAAISTTEYLSDIQLITS